MFNIIFLLIVSFVVYELTIGFLICYYKKPIIAYVNKAKKVFSNSKVILNLSYGLVINGMFGLINFETGWQIMFFICLTAFGLIGIINTANVDE